MKSTQRSAAIGRVALVVIVLASTVAACGGDGGGIQVEGAWARASAAVANAGAAYMEISNEGTTDDALVGARVDASVAATVEIHESVAMDGAMGDDTTMAQGSATTMGGGMMTMQPVDEIPLPAGQTVTLEPGGYHLMLLDLVGPLESGTTITITLTFESADEETITADVRDTAP